ncbi:MAG: Lrp/AsnC family transcriptional regulator [Tabrizicola sp.]|uniref:Lrp/AsnC family transcriptional regulator n=1 Tax=Tabrizicola sp. TaxID=2005166 RepID=UPI003BB0B902
MRKFDPIDQLILSALQKNARMSMKSLANAAGVARSTLGERLARLEKEGTIQGYHAKLGKLDSSVEAMLFVVLSSTPSILTAKAILEIPGVQSCASLAGEIDLLAHLVTHTSEELNTIRNTISEMPTVAKVTTHIILRWE